MGIGGFDPEKRQQYVMYYFTGGGYGGSAEIDGLSNGCSITGISKMQPVEVLEQLFPVLFEEFSLAERSGGAGYRRGGFGVHTRIRLRRGQARASFVMDHGRFGPPGALGGRDARLNEVEIIAVGRALPAAALSKDQDIVLEAGDVITVRTPGGGGYGDPFKREPALVARDVRRGYYDRNDAAEEYGVVLTADAKVDVAATERRRALGNSALRRPLGP